MVPLTGPLLSPAIHETRWLNVAEPSSAAAARAAGMSLARQAGFAALRADQLALAVSEAASNLHKHAQDGQLLLQICHGPDGDGIELVTIDSGPGVRDVRAVLRDGHSTAGTLGIGLGTIRRMADWCEIYSVPGRGTVLSARFWPGASPPPPASGGLIRPITGESECGDAFAVIRSGGQSTSVMCDGLGHGPLAAIAAKEAIAAVMEAPPGPPAVLLERVHQRLGKTRGGAVAIAQADGEVLRYAGLGNIAGWMLAGDARTGLPSVPGIAGHRARTIRQFEYQMPAGAVVIMHSDGVSGRWDISQLPRLAQEDPLVIAAALLTVAGTRRDDAGVLVLRP